MGKYAFEEIQYQNLPTKPRNSGLTSILDKGLGIEQACELVEVAGDWIDVIKFGWATARIVPQDILQRKIETYLSAQIQPCMGGTFLEIAYAQGRVDYFFQCCKALGLKMLEVSNGIHPMQQSEKLNLIKSACSAGFIVWSEVGKKNPQEDAQLSLGERVRAIEEELQAGAERIVLEARESGTVGIYNDKGEPVETLLKEIVSHIEVSRLVFEAPRKSQQLWLINKFSHLVNLANIPPDEAISLATLRTGLRSDTFFKNQQKVKAYLEIGMPGASNARSRGGVVLMIDGLRASATIVTALAMEMSSVKPVMSAEECYGEVTAGEVDGQKLPHAHHGNSPVELLQNDYRNKMLVLATSNGTRCLLTAAGPNTQVLVGTTLNRYAVAQAALRLARESCTPITFLLAGHNDCETIEDVLTAGEILQAMGNSVQPENFIPRLSEKIAEDFIAGESGQRLLSLGYVDDVHFCSKFDLYNVVPILRDGLLVRI